MPSRRSTFLTLLLCLGLGVGLAADHRAQAGSYYTPDGTRPKDFTLYKDGDTWHLIGIHEYYTPAPGGPGSPGLVHSTSQDMIRWTDIGPAIPVGAPGSWESYDVWAPTMIKEGNTYHLWYTGVQLVGNLWVQRIGHATSTDLTNWTKDPTNPVFDCANVSWAYYDVNDLSGYGVDCRDPFVTRDEANNRWVMYYSTRSQPIADPPLTWIEHPTMVGMATSTDLVTWVDAGPVVTTGGYTTESSHAFEHNGTWWLIWTGNCAWRSAKCLKYATGPSATGPFTGYTDLPAAGGDEHASEYFRDITGTEYLGRVGTFGGWLDFDIISWSGNSFTLTPTPAGTVSGRVWKDDNGNGILDTGENGFNSAYVDVYIDNGDDVFDTLTDTALTSTQTGNGGTVNNPLNGYYKIPLLPSFGPELPWGTLWLRVFPDSFENTIPPMTGYSPTSPTVIKFVNPSNAILTGANFGYNSADSTAPAGVIDLQTK